MMSSGRNLSPGRDTHKEFIILVSGLPRSGTSMMMEMLQAGGIPILTDNHRVPDEDNPRGYFEMERVKNIPEGDIAWLSESSGKALKIIAPFIPFLPVDFQYKVIFMERDLEEILSSQKVMLSRQNTDFQNEDAQKIREIFHRNLKSVIEYMEKKTNFTFLLCDYIGLLRDPLPIITNISTFLGVDLHLNAMVDIVDPDLYRQRKLPPFSEVQ